MIDRTDLHAYVDGELGQDERRHVEQALGESPDLAREIAAIQSLKEALSQRTPSVTCEDTWRRCCGRMDEVDKTRRIESFVGRYAWGLCGAFLAVIVIGGGISRSQNDGRSSAELARMVATLVPGTSASMEQRELGQFVDRLMGQAQASISPERLTILNRAQGEIDGQRVCRLTLRDPFGDLALVLREGSIDLTGLARAEEQSPYYMAKIGRANCIVWTVNGASLILVSDRSHADLVKVAKRMADGANQVSSPR